MEKVNPKGDCQNGYLRVFIRIILSMYTVSYVVHVRFSMTAYDCPSLSGCSSKKKAIEGGKRNYDHGSECMVHVAIDRIMVNESFFFCQSRSE